MDMGLTQTNTIESLARLDDPSSMEFDKIKGNNGEHDIAILKKEITILSGNLSSLRLDNDMLNKTNAELQTKYNNLKTAFNCSTFETGIKTNLITR